MTEPRRAPGAPWYVRTFNHLSAAAAELGLARPEALRPEALRQAARRRAPQCYSFASPALKDPLERLCADVDRHSRASATGRIAMVEHLVELLAARLRLVRRWEQVGEGRVAAEPVERPVFIFGLPRTGTTLLHNLIAQDPDVRVPWTYEVMMPTSQPGALSRGARRAAVGKRLRWVDRLAPDFRSVHEVSATLPQECIAITAHALQSIEFHTTHRLPDYENWLEQSDQRPAYAFHRRFLQHLQHEDRLDGSDHSSFDARRWVLKAPGHLFALEALLDAYPDAVLVQTHRDPLEVVASISSHGVILRQAFSDQVDPHEVASDWSARWCGALERTLALRAREPELNARILDVHYQQTLSDPIDTIAAIYAHAGLSLSEQARARMATYLTRNPQGRHGRHRYSLEEFGLSRNAEQERYASYRHWLGLA
ncbi:MAG: sulfotransferase [Pseudomonadota bacterium]